MAFLTDDISINTIIGKGSAVSGDIKINGFVRVDGDVDGNLETQSNIIIGASARIRGNVQATSAVISGIVIGDVIAPAGIKLLSTAAVIGDITTRRLVVEDKVVLHGKCNGIEEPEEEQPARMR
ncbi:MAG: polymer-forming cytoskeletal protein [Treponema sp.]|nr:polymer-forming cytoskeletal protein [Treponema sp.]